MNIKKSLEAIEYPIPNYGVEEPRGEPPQESGLGLECLGPVHGQTRTTAEPWWHVGDDGFRRGALRRT